MIYETLEGRSKEKDFVKAYREAITDAFTMIAALNYNYTPSTKQEKQEMVVVNMANDVKELPEDTQEQNIPSTGSNKVPKQAESIVKANKKEQAN